MYRRLLIAAITVLVVVAVTPDNRAGSDLGYEFELLASLGDPAPGGGDFVFDFEPNAINNPGQVFYGADLDLDGDGVEDVEGLFLRDKDGETTVLARGGDPAPGTDTTFGPFFIGGTSLNDRGDAAFGFWLEPVDPQNASIGAGVFRFSHETQTVTPVFLPGVTEAPGGGVFAGATIRTSLNSRGDLAFAAIVTEGNIAPGPPGVDGEDLGVGVFVHRDDGDDGDEFTSVVRPGDPAPGGGLFDFAENPWINNRGDVAFGAHVDVDECVDTGASQEERIFCAESVFLKTHKGEVISIARQGEAVPDSAGGGTYRLAFGPVINDRGQVVFNGDLTEAPGVGEALGIFLWEKGETIAVARPGDVMPGGGTIVTASFFITSYDLNARGDVSFSAALDTDGDEVSDATGVFVWSKGAVQVVAQTGTVIPGIGTVEQILPPDLVGIFPDFFPWPWFGEVINNRGQVTLTVALEGEDEEDESVGSMLLATPSGGR